MSAIPRQAIFSIDEREIFEDMCISLEMCIESTELLFRPEIEENVVLPAEINDVYFIPGTLDRIRRDAAQNPEDWQ